MSQKPNRLRSARISITCADIPGMLLCINQRGVILCELEYADALTVYAQIAYRHYNTITEAADRYGAAVKLVSRSGIWWSTFAVLRRPVMVLTCLLLWVLSFWLPEKIFLIEVAGNIHTPDHEILEQAANCGILFGASSRDVRSEYMKNQLLEALPQLEWAGVNTFGCRAVISVREKPETEAVKPDNCVSSIVATYGGKIQSLTVTGGTALCKVGDTVNPGDVLISGYTDCGLLIRATQAKGEVFATTERVLDVFTPLIRQYRVGKMQTKTNYSVIIGKKRINFFKDSGILGTTCVKMYIEYPLILPGGFALPITLVAEQYCFYACEDASADLAEVAESAAAYARQYLLSQMISGCFLDFCEETQKAESVLIYRGMFSCTEMIGRVRYEGTTNFYGKSD